MLRVSSRSAVVVSHFECVPISLTLTIQQRSLLSGIRRQSTKDATVEDWTINPVTAPTFPAPPLSFLSL